MGSSTRTEWLVITALAAGWAHADDGTARTEANEGRVAFESNDFVQAIEHYEAAWRLRPVPALLFNLAQSHRLAGNLDKAIFYCGRFLDTRPPQAQVDMTEGLLRHLELEQLRVVNSLRLELEKTRLEVAKHEALTVSRRLELERALMADWEAHPVTTRWWFWTGLAALTAGTVVAVVALGLAPASR